MFSIGCYSIGPSELKFGMDNHINSPKVMYRLPLGWVRGPKKPSPRVCTAQTMSFCENFIKRKLKNAPNLMWAGQVR